MKNILFLSLLILVLSVQSALTKPILGQFFRSLDLALEVSKGNVPGHLGRNQQGRTINADAAAATDLWDGALTTVIWVAPTVARIHNIASSSASDDGAPVGVGAQTIRVFGLTSWATREVSEVIILNGVGNVPTVNAYVIINNMEVLAKGATSINVGTITATAVTDATITAQINVGVGRTETSIFGIPSIQSAHLTNLHVFSEKLGGAAKIVDFSLLLNLTPLTELLNFTFRDGGTIVGVGSEFKPYNPYLKVPGPAIIKVQVVSDTADTEVSSNLGVIIADN